MKRNQDADAKTRTGWGGARPGAGRPKKQPEPLGLDRAFDDPALFLRAVMNDRTADARLRVDAAKALLPFVHPRMGETGKRAAAADAAEAVLPGRFKPASPPLSLVRGAAATPNQGNDR